MEENDYYNKSQYIEKLIKEDLIRRNEKFDNNF